MKVGYGPQVVPSGLPGVQGIFVGGCVERGIGSSFRHRGHAHNERKDPLRGWICIRSAYRVYTDAMQPTRLLWHEYAHILTPGHGHDDKWREAMRYLRQPIPARYQKRERRQ